MNRQRKCAIYIPWNIINTKKEENPAICHHKDGVGGLY